MPIELETLERMGNTSLQRYIADRINEVKPEDPKVPPGGNYSDFLVNSIHGSNRLTSRIALAVVNIFQDMAEQVTEGGDKSEHYTALRHLSVVIPYLKEELHEVSGGMKTIEEVAVGWMEEEGILSTESSIWPIFNSFLEIQQEGDDPEPWKRLWNREDHPNLWTPSYGGLSQANLSAALGELPRLVQRSREGWNPRIALWHLYQTAKAKDKPTQNSGLEELANSIKALEEKDVVIGTLTKLEAAPEHIALFSS